MTTVSSEWSAPISFTIKGVGNSYREVSKLSPPRLSANDYFSRPAISGDGQHMLVGAIGDDTKATDAGAVYYYKRVAGSWNLIQKFYPSTSAASELFGSCPSLNTDGTIAAIGCQNRSVNGSLAGTVFIFKRTGDAWAQDAAVISPDLQTNDGFGIGCSLSGDGTVLAIGAAQEARFGTNAGKVYLFKKVNNTWVAHQTLFHPNFTAGAAFGVKVLLTADASRLFISAYKDSAENTNAGAVFVYIRSDRDEWIYQQRILPDTATASLLFGFSIASDETGDVVMISAAASEISSASGCVFLYEYIEGFYVQKQKLLALDAGVSDNLGIHLSMSMDRDILVVGSFNANGGATNSGAIYTYERVTNDFVYQQKLLASDGAASDWFGSGVALSADGSMALIGVHNDDDKGVDSGSVRVFIRTGSIWIEVQKLTASDGVTLDWFGRSVAINADATVALIGAHGDDDKGSNSGSVYVFTRSDTVWTQQQKIYAAIGVVDSYFGISVALNADASLALVGSHGDSDKGAAAGAVYVFTRSGSVWTQQQKLTAGDGAAGDSFGRSVALNADATVALIGAVGDDDKGSNTGSVYVFTRSGVVWTQQIKLTASDGAVDDYFGISVALNSNATMAFIGAYGDDDKAANSGSVYVFTHYGEAWIQVQKIIPNDGSSSDWFGTSVALNADGSIAFIGAYGDDDKASEAGSVYCFVNPTTYDGLATFSYVPKIDELTYLYDGKIFSPDGVASDYFGRSHALSGDGRIMAVGAPGDDDSASAAGCVYIYKRNDRVWEYVQKLIASDAAESAYFGAGIALNNDGSLLFIGAHSRNTYGAVYVYENKEGVHYTYSYVRQASDAAASDRFGWEIAVNHDATVILVCASFEDTGGTNIGSVYTYARSGTVWTDTGKIISPTATGITEFGKGIALNSAGTLAVIGSPNEDTGGVNAGCAYVYENTGSGWTLKQTLRPGYQQAADNYGSSTAVTDDGIIFVAAYTANHLGTSTGCVYIYKPKDGIWIEERKLYSPEYAVNDNFGYAMSVTPDGSILSIATNLAYGVADQTGVVHTFTNPLKYDQTANLDLSQEHCYTGTVYAYDAAADDRFGYGCDFSGDGNLLFIAAIVNGTGGVCYAYQREGLKYRLLDTFTTNDVAADDYVGLDIASNYDGSLIVVTAYGDDASGTVLDTGSIYFFKLINNDWQQVKKFVQPGLVASDHFGRTVCLSDDGTMLFVGSPGYSSTGCFYWYTLNDVTPTLVRRVIPSFAVANSGIGYGAALSKDKTTLALSGTYGEGSSAGKTAIFKMENGDWVERQIIVAPDPLSLTFGRSVDIDETGTRMLISANFDSKVGTKTGALHYYKLIEGVWTYQHSNRARDRFGLTSSNYATNFAITWDFNHLVIDYINNDDKAADAGCVHTYVSVDMIDQLKGPNYGIENLPVPRLHQVSKISAPNPTAESMFGSCITFSGDGKIMAVGASKDPTWVSGGGTLYLYEKVGQCWKFLQKVQVADNASTEADRFGRSAALNYDGSRLFVGSPLQNDTATDDGRVYVFDRTDGFWTEVYTIKPATAVNNLFFGVSLACDYSGKNLIVGASGDGTVNGRFYHYTEGSSKQWNRICTVLGTTIGCSAAARFGTRVAGDGELKTLLVSAAWRDGSRLTDSGMIYEFVRRGTEWLPKSTIQIPTRTAGDLLGAGVDISSDGTKAFVLAAYSDIVGTNLGVIYTLVKINDAWIVDQPIYPVDNVAREVDFTNGLGYNSADGILAVGIPDDTPLTNAGSVYFYQAPGWTYTMEDPNDFVVRQKIYPSASSAAGIFGRDVAISSDGSTLVIGEPYKTANAKATAGIVNVYKRQNGLWVYSTSFYPADVVAADNFGMAVAVNRDGTEILVGSPYCDTIAVNAGAAYFFKLVSGVWTQAQKFYSSDLVTNDLFGMSVTMDECATVAVIGSRLDDDKGSESGSAYIFVRQNGTWRQQQKIVLTAGVTLDYFGERCALSPDGNFLAISNAKLGSANSAGCFCVIYIRQDMNFVYQCKLTVPDIYLGEGRMVPTFSRNANNLIITSANVAFYYERTNGVFQYRGCFKSPDGGTFATFGIISAALSQDGREIYIGDHVDTDFGASSGTVYAFENYFVKEQVEKEYYKQVQILGDVTVQAELSYGIAIAVDSDARYLFIGDYLDTTKGTKAGCVRVYYRADKDWVLQQVLYNTEPAENDYFGIGLSTNGDASKLVVVTATPNKARIFDRTGSVFTEVQVISLVNEPFDYGCNLGVGCSLSKDGVYLAFGGADGTLYSGYSVTYIFKFDGSQYVFQTKIRSINETLNELQNYSVAFSEDASEIAIGAPYTNWTGAGTGTGSVRIFSRIGDDWVYQQRISYPGDLINVRFGRDVAYSENDQVLFITAPGEIENGIYGHVYMYRKVNGAWTLAQKLRHQHDATSAGTGQNVDATADGKYMFVSSVSSDLSGTNKGSVYVFARHDVAVDYGYEDDFEATSKYDLQKPLYSQALKIVANDAAASDRFGYSTAIDATGRYLAVGSPRDDTGATDTGSVYIYFRDNGVWTERSKIDAYDAVASDYFGSGVALSADATILAVGCMYCDDKGTNAGSVHIYFRYGTTWRFIQKLYAFDPAASDQFGQEVGLSSDGQYLIVGSVADDDKGTDSGSAYVFYKEGVGYTFQAKLVAPDGATTDAFGRSVALSSDGSLALIGAYYDDDYTANAGSVYFFARVGTTWTYQEKWISPINAGVRFGRSVGISDDGSTIVVGLEADATKGTDAGSVIVYRKTEGVWAEAQRLYAADASASAQFGACKISANGEFIVVGADGDSERASGAGAVYLFARNDVNLNYDYQSSFEQVKKYFPQSASAAGYFGTCIAVSEDDTVMLVGEPAKNPGSIATGGVVNFYLRNTFGEWVFQNSFRPTDLAAGDYFGYAVAINGVGTLAAISSRYDDDKGADSGSVYIYSRAGTVWTQIQKLVATDGVTLDYYGSALAMSNDGRYLFVGSPNDDDKGTNSGSVYVYVTSGTLYRYQSKLTDPNGIAANLFGSGVACNASGDILAIASAGYGTNTGKVDLYYRQENIYRRQFPINVSLTGLSSLGLGMALSAEGDLLLIGQYTASTYGANCGVVYAYTRKNGLWSFYNEFYANDVIASSYFGRAIAVSKNGKKIYIGASGDTEYGASGGAVYEFLNKISSDAIYTESEQDVFIPGHKFQSVNTTIPILFGASLSISGNGRMMAVGSPDSSPSATAGGTVWMFTLIDNMWEATQQIYPSDAVAGDGFGYSVALNKDATVMLVGSSKDDDKATDAGSVYVYTRVGMLWTYQSKIYSNPFGASVYFGARVALNAEGTLAFISANGSDTKGTDTGALFVFARKGATWLQLGIIYAPDFAVSDIFGWDVAITEDESTLFIGAGGDDDAAVDAGSVYVFTRSETLVNGVKWWEYSYKLKPSLKDVGGQFGFGISVSPDGELLAIGAPSAATGSITAVGRVYLYKKIDGVYKEDQLLQSKSYYASQLFGYSVAISYDKSEIFVGAPGDSAPGIANAGSVHSFVLQSKAFNPHMTVKPTGATVALKKMYLPHASGLGEQMGVGLAISGDGNIMLIGTYKVGGRVYAYEKNASGDWDLKQTLTTGTTITGSFGAAIALDYTGTYAIIGVMGDDVGGVSSTGSVQYWKRTGSTWTYIQRLLASDRVAGDYFGLGIAMSADGTYAMIGAYRDDTPNTDSGTAYIFTRSGDVWTQQGKFYNTWQAATSCMGEGMALSSDGKWMIQAVQKAGTSYGEVYIYRKVNNTWIIQEILSAPDRHINDYFGFRVALNYDGSILVVGAGNNNQLGAASGAVYIYTRQAGIWTYRRKLLSPEYLPGMVFGISVSLSSDGKDLAVGCQFDNLYGTNAGAVYHFRNEEIEASDIPLPIGLVPTYRLASPDIQAGDAFGVSAALSGNGQYLFIGASTEDTGGADAGCVYVFTYNNGEWVYQTTLRASDIAAGDYFGARVTTNFDGSMIAVGSPLDDATVINTGSIYIFTRSGTVWTQVHKQASPQPSSGASYGISVALTSDGTMLAVGCVGDSRVLAVAGSVYLYSVAGTVLTPAGELTAPDPAVNNGFGNNLVFSGDGSYLFITARDGDQGATDSGNVYVYKKINSTYTYQFKLSAYDAVTGQAFGQDVATNADGSILYVGSRANSDFGTAAGCIYKYGRMGDGSYTFEKKLYSQYPVANSNFGMGLSLSGDGTMLVAGEFNSSLIHTTAGSAIFFVDPVAHPEAL